MLTDPRSLERQAIEPKSSVYLWAPGVEGEPPPLAFIRCAWLGPQTCLGALASRVFSPCAQRPTPFGAIQARTNPTFRQRQEQRGQALHTRGPYCDGGQRDHQLSFPCVCCIPFLCNKRKGPSGQMRSAPTFGKSENSGTEDEEFIWIESYCQDPWSCGARNPPGTHRL